jgi:hypothetical protein
MTDENLAKEYARENKRVIECNCHNYDSEKDLEKAFLAGRQSNSEYAVELEEANADLKQSLDWANETENVNVRFIGKLKKYANLLQDICTVLGNDIYMVSAGLESRVKILWDFSEEKEGLKMVEDIENRLLEIKPQDWAEIEGW